jgi:hypothetical protein
MERERDRDRERRWSVESRADRDKSFAAWEFPCPEEQLRQDTIAVAFFLRVVRAVKRNRNRIDKGRSWPGRSWPGRLWPGQLWPGQKETKRKNPRFDSWARACCRCCNSCLTRHGIGLICIRDVYGFERRSGVFCVCALRAACFVDRTQPFIPSFSISARMMREL